VWLTEVNHIKSNTEGSLHPSDKGIRCDQTVWWFGNDFNDAFDPSWTSMLRFNIAGAKCRRQVSTGSFLLSNDRFISRQRQSWIQVYRETQRLRNNDRRPKAITGFDR
jgi:hypothetical protein